MANGRSPADFGFFHDHGQDTVRHPRLASSPTCPKEGIGAIAMRDLVRDPQGVILQGRIAAEYIRYLQHWILSRARRAVARTGGRAMPIGGGTVTEADFGFVHNYDTWRRPRLGFSLTCPDKGIGALSERVLADDPMGVILQGRVAAAYIDHLERRLLRSAQLARDETGRRAA